MKKEIAILLFLIGFYNFTFTTNYLSSTRSFLSKHSSSYFYPLSVPALAYGYHNNYLAGDTAVASTITAGLFEDYLNNKISGKNLALISFIIGSTLAIKKSVEKNKQQNIQQDFISKAKKMRTALELTQKANALWKGEFNIDVNFKNSLTKAHNAIKNYNRSNPIDESNLINIFEKPFSIHLKKSSDEDISPELMTHRVLIKITNIIIQLHDNINDYSKNDKKINQNQINYFKALLNENNTDTQNLKNILAQLWNALRKQIIPDILSEDKRYKLLLKDTTNALWHLIETYKN